MRSVSIQQGTGHDPDADVTFHDPMADPMPYAPSLKMFCVYGVNKPVERYAIFLRVIVMCPSEKSVRAGIRWDIVSCLQIKNHQHSPHSQVLCHLCSPGTPLQLSMRSKAYSEPMTSIDRKNRM